MGDAGESVDEGRDEAGDGGGGDVGWWRTEACRGKKKRRSAVTGSGGFHLRGSTWCCYNVFRQRQSVHIEMLSHCIQKLKTCTHTHTHTLAQADKIQRTHKARDLKLPCISSLMQGHGCDASLSHICHLLWHILQDSWEVNLWKMSLSVVFVRYPAGSHCSRWWNHYATSEREGEKNRRSGLDSRGLQMEICFNEQVAKTQRCLLLLYIIKRQNNNSWQFDKWVGHNIYGTRLKGSSRKVHEWNRNWMLPVLSCSMHFKRTLLSKVFPIMPGTSKYPFWAESHCVMVSLKRLLRGKASKLVEVRLPWGPPLNLETLALIGQKAQVVTETLRHAISPQSGASVKNPLWEVVQIG